MRAIQQCSTDLYRTAVTSSYCVSYRRLAINVYMTFTIEFRIGSECPFTERVVIVKTFS